MLELLKDNFYEKILKYDICCGLSVTSVVPALFHITTISDVILKIIANNVHIWSSLPIHKELDSAFRLIRIVVRMLI